MKTCKDCERTIPEGYIIEYSYLYLTPICPLCALSFTKELYKRGFKEDIYLKNYEKFLGEKETKLKQAWGGHMINPPKECPYRFIAKDKGEWVDLQWCVNYCKDICKRKMIWKRMTRGEKKFELEVNRVRTA